MKISSEIISWIYDSSKNFAYYLSCGNCLAMSNIHSTHFGIETISNIAAKIWNKIPNEIKEVSSLTVLKVKLNNQKTKKVKLMKQ